MTCVLKFELETGEFNIRTHEYARPLFVAMQLRSPKIWMMVDTSLPMRNYRMITIRNADQCPEPTGFNYVGSIIEYTPDIHVFIEQD